MKLSINIALAVGIVALLSGIAPLYAQVDLAGEIANIQPDEDGPIVGFDPMAMAARPPQIGARFGGPCGPGGFGAGPFGELSGDLALTDEQSEKLFALKNQLLDKVAPKMLEAISLERQIRDLMTRPQIDRQKLAELENKVIEAKMAVASIKMSGMLDSAELLTPDQRKALRQRLIKGGPLPGGHHHQKLRG